MTILCSVLTQATALWVCWSESGNRFREELRFLTSIPRPGAALRVGLRREGSGGHWSAGSSGRLSSAGFVVDFWFGCGDGRNQLQGKR